jgi:hypothetical protein
MKRLAKKRTQKYVLDDILPFRAQYHLVKFYASRVIAAIEVTRVYHCATSGTGQFNIK